jgi:hypothetical protein
VTSPRITTLHALSNFLEIPLRDFEHLPLHMGCSLHRSRGALVMASSQAGCSLTFEVIGDEATLTHLEVTNDVEAQFTRDGVVGLFVMYGGDLEATLEWDPVDAEQEADLVIRRGKTSHPLVDEPAAKADPQADLAMAMVEQWLTDSHLAWNEYLRLKQSSTPSNVTS